MNNNPRLDHVSSYWGDLIISNMTSYDCITNKASHKLPDQNFHRCTDCGPFDLAGRKKTSSVPTSVLSSSPAISPTKGPIGTVIIIEECIMIGSVMTVATVIEVRSMRRMIQGRYPTCAARGGGRLYRRQLLDPREEYPWRI